MSNHRLHPVHIAIGNLITLIVDQLEKDYTVIKDPACYEKDNSNQHIPLFCSNERSNSTKFCNVDILILRKQKIRVIVEIEESHVGPTQIAGKFLTSALATHLIHDLHNGLHFPGTSMK
jgi:hypothetical protein